MITRSVAACVLLLSVSLPVAAQVPPAPTGGNQSSAGGVHGLRDPGVWRASDLIGQDVFTADNQDIGEVSDVILSREGRLDGVVVDAGGFLGAGERRVAVRFDALQIVPTGTNVVSGTLGGLPPSTREGAQARQSMLMNNVITPARIVLNVTKDQLQSAPRFQGGR